MSDYSRPPRINDPFGGFIGIPQLLDSIGQGAGSVLAGVPNIPVLGGALQGLGTVAGTALDTFVRTPVGGAALLADQFLDTGLTRAASDRLGGRPGYELPKTALDALLGAYQQVAEDPDASAFERALAQGARGTELAGEMVAPIVPGIGLAKGLAPRFVRSSIDEARAARGVSSSLEDIKAAVGLESRPKAQEPDMPTQPVVEQASPPPAESVAPAVATPTPSPVLAIPAEPAAGLIGDEAGRIDELLRKAATFDKRSQKLGVNADEAETLLRFMDRQPGLDPARVGALRVGLEAVVNEQVVADEFRKAARVVGADAEDVARIATREANKAAVDIRVGLEGRAAEKIGAVDVTVAQTNYEKIASSEAGLSQKAPKRLSLGADWTPSYGERADTSAKAILRQLPKYHPDTAAYIREAVESDPERFARLVETLSHEDLLRNLAPVLGMKMDEAAKALPNKGELTANIVAAQMALDKRAVELNQVARAGRDSDAFKKAVGDYYDLVFQVSEGGSEIGRALGAMRLAKDRTISEALDVAQEAYAVRRGIKEHERSLAKAQDEVVRLNQEVVELRYRAGTELNDDIAERIRSDAYRAESAAAQADLRVRDINIEISKRQQKIADLQEQHKNSLEQARRALMDKAIAEKVTKDKVVYMAAFEPDDILGMQQYLAQVLPMSVGEKIYSAWISNILTGPKTVAVNLSTSQLSFWHSRLVHAVQASLTEPALAKLQGRGPEVYWQEVAPGLVAASTAYPQGVARALEAMRTGMGYSRMTEGVKASLGGRGPKVVGDVTVGDIFSPGLRASQATDITVRYPAEAVKRSDLAWRRAYKELSSGGKSVSNEEWARRSEDILRDPAFIRETRDEVVAEGRRHAFSDEGHAITKSFAAVIDRLALPEGTPLLGHTPLGRYVVPFLNIADRLISSGVKFIPGEQLVEGVVRAGRGETAKASEALAAGVVNTTLAAMTYAAFGILHARGDITFSAPAGANERREWEAEGKIRYAVRINGTWYEWGRFEPFVLPLKWMAAIGEGAQAKQGREWDEQAQEIVGRLGKSFSDASYLKGVGDLVSAVANPGQEVPRIFNDTVAGFLPEASLFRQSAREIDPYKREPKNVLETIQAEIPFASFGVQPKRDVLGRPIIQTQGATIPVGFSRSTPQPVLEEAKRLQVVDPDFKGLAPMERSFFTDAQKIDLDTGQENRLQELGGTAQREALDRLLVSADYQAANDEAKVALFRKTMDSARRAGRKAFGLEMALGATDGKGVINGGLVAFVNSQTNYDKGSTVAMLAQRGLLSQALVSALDARRDQTDPKKPNYDMSVAEYLHGKELVDAYRRVPEFIIGDPGVWSRAYEAQRLYAKMLDAIETGASKLDRLDPRLLQFYTEAAGGWLLTLYTRGGSRRTALVPLARRQIERDRLWSHFDQDVRTRSS